MSALDLLFPLSLAALALVAVVAARHPILSVMAWRNTLRRPRQSVLVVLGLLVGTAIVSGALVAGDSMEYAIVEATYDAFHEIDETVYLDGYNFFPASVADALASDAVLRRSAEAVGVNILWDAAATDERSRQYEPGVRLVGFDPGEAPVWGAFVGGGDEFSAATLARDDVVLHRDLAKKLDARTGDLLTLNFTRPQDPLLPRIETVEGVLNVSVAGVPPILAHAEPRPYNVTVHVEAAVQLSVALGWDPGAAGQDLDLEVVAPDGRVHADANGTVGAPDGSRARPVVVNVTGSISRPVPPGDWTVRVHGKAAAETPFGLALVQLEPVFDLDEFQRRVEALRDEFPDFDPSAVAASLARESRSVRVAFVADGGKGPNFKLPTAMNLFLRLDTLQAWLDRDGQVNLVKVSNPGGVIDGADRTDDVYPVLYARLNETKRLSPDDPAVQALRANADKAFWLDQARQLGQTFSIFLTFIGSFSVIAGLMLIINIFTMLAEERKAELGISRAVGLRQAHLTRLFTLEGALYALPAAALGTLLGVALARGLIAGFNAFGDAETFPPIPFRLLPASLLLAFATGILLTLATVYVGARRVSRLNVVRAIRNLEEPEIVRGRLSLAAGALVAAAGAAATLAAFTAGSFAAQVLGPSALALGAAMVLRRWLRRVRVYPPLAAALLGYLVLNLFLVREYDTFEGNVFGPIRAVLMALCVVVLVVYTEAPVRLLGRLAQRVPPLRAVAVPATSYPLHKKFRAGMTLAMFAVILLVVSLFSIFGALFAPDPTKEAGGYDVEARALVPIERLEDHGTDPTLLGRIDHYSALPFFLQVGGTLVRVDNATSGQFGPPLDHVFGIDGAFAADNRFRLLRRDAAYAADTDVYRAVAASDDLAIVAYPYSTDEQGNDDVHHVGAQLQVDAKGGVKTFRVVGVQEQVHFKGIFVSRGALASMYSDRDALLLIALRPGQDAEATARDLEAAYRDVGLDAGSIRTEVLEESEQFRQIFTLIQLFLSLGLVVGILSLGIVTARSVIERRQEIGMMRAVGYRRRDIRRTFLFEMLTTVVLGVLIGALLAIVVSLGLWVAIVRELNIPYRVPWTDLAVIALIAFVATTLATLAPIVRASRIPPADALRYIE